MAPPTPWRARARISVPLEGESAAHADPSGEDRQADDEEPLPAEAVAEGSTHEEQRGEGEGVGVDGPFEVAQRRPEVAPDDRQGHGHDQVVEADHEEGDRCDGEGPERLRIGGTCWWCSFRDSRSGGLTKYSLSSAGKKGGCSADRGLTSGKGAQVVVEGRAFADAGNDVDEHSLGEPALDGLVIGARDSGHVPPQIAVARPERPPESRRPRRRRRPGAGAAAGSGRTSAGGCRRGPSARGSRPARDHGARAALPDCSKVRPVRSKQSRDRGDEEILLGAEQLEEVGLGDARPTGDRVSRGSCVAADGELDGGGRNDFVAAFVGGEAGGCSWRVT